MLDDIFGDFIVRDEPPAKKATEVDSVANGGPLSAEQLKTKAELLQQMDAGKAAEMETLTALAYQRREEARCVTAVTSVTEEARCVPARRWRGGAEVQRCRGAEHTSHAIRPTPCVPRQTSYAMRSTPRLHAMRLPPCAPSFAVSHPTEGGNQDVASSSAAPALSSAASPNADRMVAGLRRRRRQRRRRRRRRPRQRLAMRPSRRCRCHRRHTRHTRHDASHALQVRPSRRYRWTSLGAPRRYPTRAASRQA